ncbi:MAG TPA: DUF72 domain-containing protein [Pseudomonadales bacterium]
MTAKTTPSGKAPLSREERRLRKEQRRARQREANVGRALKMRKLRLSANSSPPGTRARKTRTPAPAHYVGCSGWYYWHLRDSFYSGLPQKDWFAHYAKNFSTVEINASFYSWPTEANVKGWLRQVGRKRFTYTVKACELITHVKRFRNTKTLVQDFGYIADLLGPRMGCFLFQLPPSFRYTAARLRMILAQLDPRHRNVVEFRHASWWNDEVYTAFRDAGAIFCSCSGPRLPDTLVKTADDVYIRFHGVKRWYRHDYTVDELQVWVDRIRESGAKRVWIYFNNDNDAYAMKNARTMKRLLKPSRGRKAPAASRRDRPRA